MEEVAATTHGLTARCSERTRASRRLLNDCKRLAARRTAERDR